MGKATEIVTEAIAKILQYIWKALYLTPIDELGRFVESALSTAGEFYRKAITHSLSSTLDHITGENAIPSKVQEHIKYLLNQNDFSSLIAAVGFIIPWFFSSVYSMFPMVSQDAMRAVAERLRPSLPDTATLLVNLFRYPHNKDKYNQVLAWLGYSDEMIEMLNDAGKPILGIAELKDLFLRGEISEKIFVERLQQHGFSLGECYEIIKLIYYIPPVQDLITMAVREAFTPEIIQKYGLHEDFPPDFAAQAAKQGVSAEWAQNYWAAHWQLPSATMGFEMFHRGLITYEDLATLLKTLDIMPYWRDKMINLSYNPLTRVDVRRMYALGVLSDKEVEKSYRDIGYSPENAKKMTEFTIKYTKGAEKDLSRTDILDLLKKNLIKQSECKTELIKIGYDDKESDLLIAKTLQKKEEDIKTLSMSQIQKLYVSGVYNDGVARQKLVELKLQTNEIESLMQLWKLERESEVTLLTTEQIKQLLQAGLLTKAEYEAEMKKHKYTDLSILRLYVLWSKSEDEKTKLLQLTKS